MTARLAQKQGATDVRSRQGKTCPGVEDGASLHQKQEGSTDAADVGEWIDIARDWAESQKRWGLSGYWDWGEADLTEKELMWMNGEQDWFGS